MTALNVRSKLASVVWARSNDWPLTKIAAKAIWAALYMDKLAVMTSVSSFLNFQPKL